VHNILLNYPESSVRTNKREVERLPFVITSASWQSVMAKKEEDKK
jgi:hypothetical protein